MSQDRLQSLLHFSHALLDLRLAPEGNCGTGPRIEAASEYVQEFLKQIIAELHQIAQIGVSCDRLLDGCGPDLWVFQEVFDSTDPDDIASALGEISERAGRKSLTGLDLDKLTGLAGAVSDLISCGSGILSSRLGFYC